MPLSNVLLVTTMWDAMKDDLQSGAAREREPIQTPAFWGGMIERGSRSLRDFGTRDSALGIIGQLFNRDKVTLLLQRELVDEHKRLTDTAAGPLLQEDILRKEDQSRKELEELLRQFAEAISAGNRTPRIDSKDNALLEREARQVPERLQRLRESRLNLDAAYWETRDLPISSVPETLPG